MKPCYLFNGDVLCNFFLQAFIYFLLLLSWTKLQRKRGRGGHGPFKNFETLVKVLKNYIFFKFDSSKIFEKHPSSFRKFKILTFGSKVFEELPFC